MIDQRNLPLPLSFRSELLSQVMPSLAAGECCSLVGISGVGKSNLARFLRRRDVQEHYWGENLGWLVLIDSHSLAFGEQPDEYVVLELMVHRLIMEAESRRFDAGFISWATDLHSRLLAQPGAQLALRYFERICARLCEEYGLLLVFVFDQFEDLWQRIQPRFFLNLRNVRDQLIYRLAYLVMTRRPLSCSRPDLQAADAFWELFAPHVHGLGCYSEQDALIMLDRLSARRGVALDDRQRSRAIELTGCHPGLLRALFWGFAHHGVQLDERALLSAPTVAEECAKIYADLTAEEQQLLRVVALNLPLHGSGSRQLADLQLKQLLRGSPPAIFSPLFKAYLLHHSTGVEPGVVVDLPLRRVWLDGQPLEETLAPLEFTLVSYLARHSNRVCSRDEILQALYGEESFDVQDQRLDTLLRRLRDRLGENGREPRYLVTHRGVGVQLVHGSVRE